MIVFSFTGISSEERLAFGIDRDFVSSVMLVLNTKNNTVRQMTILGWSPVIQAPLYIIYLLFPGGCDGLCVSVLGSESGSRN